MVKMPIITIKATDPSKSRLLGAAATCTRGETEVLFDIGSATAVTPGLSPQLVARGFNEVSVKKLANRSAPAPTTGSVVATCVGAALSARNGVTVNVRLGHIEMVIVDAEGVIWSVLAVVPLGGVKPAFRAHVSKSSLCVPYALAILYTHLMNGPMRL
jgi:hypothetical protein